MRSRRLVPAAAIVLLFSVAQHARAQKCTPNDTPLTCYQIYNPPLSVATAQEVGTTNTGSPTAGSQATAAALRDFLSLFAAGVDVGKVSENGTTVILDWNLPFPFVEEYDRVKLQTLFTDSELAADVQTALGANASTAKSKLTNFDDITAQGSYSPVNRYLGRSLAPHAKLLDRLNATVGNTAVLAREVGRVIIKYNLTTFNQDTKFETIPDPTAQKEMLQTVETLASAEQAASGRSTQIVKALTKVLNNQPQAFVTAAYHYRNSLIGQDEISAKATYEMSPQSLNRFLARNGDTCEKSAATCADRLIAFAGAQDPATQPDTSDRLSFAIEYKQARRDTVDLSQYSVTTPIVRPSTHSVISTLTWGRPLTGTKLRDVRVDVAASYENISNDPTKKDRLVASLTLSQKISDTMTLPLSLTYANHTQYVPQTDKRLGIHFGISYKIPNTSGQ